MTAARFDGFQREVEDNPQRYCEHVRRAVSRQRRDVRDPPDGCAFDIDEGLRVVGWMEEYCTFTTGEFAGRRFVLQPWQVFLVTCVFGWRRGRVRRFRHASLWIARKAGKSELAAAIGLWMLFADGEGNPLVCATAASERQARLVPAAAWHMVGRFDAEAKRRFAAKRNRMTQRNPPVVEVEGGGAFMGLPKDLRGSLDGLSPSCAVIDELHAYPTSDTYDAMAEGMGARSKGLLLVISTAGEIDGIGRQQFDLACSVLAGTTRKDDLFALVFDCPREADIRDEAAWRMANPSLGVTVDAGYVASRCEEAIATGREEAFRRKQLNQWPVRECASDDTWIDGAAWDACRDAGEPGRRRAWASLATHGACTATTLLWCRGKRFCASIRLWESEPAAVRWMLRRARRRWLTCCLDPMRSAHVAGRLERQGIECVRAHGRTLPMDAFAAHVHDGAFRHRSSAGVRGQMTAVRRASRAGQSTLANADAAPIAVLLAFAVALADGGGTTMRDIPEWDAI